VISPCHPHAITGGARRLQTGYNGHSRPPAAGAEVGTYAEDKQHALDAVKKFEAAYGAKFGKAVAKITDDLDELLAFYDYPAERWVHLRTTNPIGPPSPPSGSAHESPRAPVPAPSASRRPSSSSSPPRTAGAWPTHPTWSPWSARREVRERPARRNDPAN